MKFMLKLKIIIPPRWLCESSMNTLDAMSDAELAYIETKYKLQDRLNTFSICRNLIDSDLAQNRVRIEAISTWRMVTNILYDVFKKMVVLQKVNFSLVANCIVLLNSSHC